MGAALPFTNGETESQRRSQSSKHPNRQLRPVAPHLSHTRWGCSLCSPPSVPHPAGVLPSGSQTPCCAPSAGVQRRLAAGVGPCPPGTHPSVSQSLGFPSGTRVIWRLPRRGKGQGLPGPSGAQLISGKGITFQLLLLIPERLFFGAFSPPPRKLGLGSILGLGRYQGGSVTRL